MKQSAALQSYNALVKNYAAVIKTLFGLLPPMERPRLSAWEQMRSQMEVETEEERKARLEKDYEDFMEALHGKGGDSE